jgi:hypothetical protein
VVTYSYSYFTLLRRLYSKTWASWWSSQSVRICLAKIIRIRVTPFEYIRCNLY